MHTGTHTYTRLPLYRITRRHLSVKMTSHRVILPGATFSLTPKIKHNKQTNSHLKDLETEDLVHTHSCDLFIFLLFLQLFA